MPKREVIVFTNGCFDIIHSGHIDLLRKARSLGTKLIVGVNSDRSAREIKGAPRPFLEQESRAAILREMRSVDETRIFDENTPERLIREIKPDVLVKGGDWQPSQIIGADFVLENGGKVFSIPFKRDISSSQLVEKIRATHETAFKPVVDDPQKSSAKFSTTGLLRAFEPQELSGIERGAEFMTKVLKAGGRIHVAGAERLAEDLERCFGVGKVFKIDFRATSEISFETGDLLIAVGAGSETEEIAGALSEARKAGCGVLVLTGAGGKKLAGLSDVCVLMRFESAGDFLWRQSAVGYYWRRAAELQKGARMENV
ncbi:MAG: adenylyltransferase/cytidyltransferase family protein [Pyrinomonadaceae bacterium]